MRHLSLPCTPSRSLILVSGLKACEPTAVFPSNVLMPPSTVSYPEIAYTAPPCSLQGKTQRKTRTKGYVRTCPASQSYHCATMMGATRYKRMLFNETLLETFITNVRWSWHKYIPQHDRKYTKMCGNPRKRIKIICGVV